MTLARLNRSIANAAKPVQPPKPEGVGRVFRNRQLPQAPIPPEDLGDATPEEVGKAGRRRDAEYVAIEITTSKGKKQRLFIPQSYAGHIPKVWEWTKARYEAAQLIADGVPVRQVADAVGVGSRMTIYGWLEHPEFKEHVDTLISETSYASQRERVAGLTKLTRMLFTKLENEIDHVRLTDKSLGAIISGIQGGLKQVAQEKGEFIEQQSIQQQTNITGSLGVASLDVTELMKAKTDEERAALEKEFDAMGDELIRSITGAKE